MKLQTKFIPHHSICLHAHEKVGRLYIMTTKIISKWFNCVPCKTHFLYFPYKDRRWQTYSWRCCAVAEFSRYWAACSRRRKDTIIHSIPCLHNIQRRTAACETQSCQSKLSGIVLREKKDNHCFPNWALSEWDVAHWLTRCDWRRRRRAGKMLYRSGKEKKANTFLVISGIQQHLLEQLCTFGKQLGRKLWNKNWKKLEFNMSFHFKLF